MLLKDIEIEHFKDSTEERSSISLAQLEAYLRKIVGKGEGRRHFLPWFGLKMITDVKQAHGELEESNMKSYEGVFEMIHALHEGLRLEESGLWALGYPTAHHAFYGKAEFYDFIDAGPELLFPDNEKQLPISTTQLLLYGVILERFYGMPNSNEKVLYKSNVDGFDRYFEFEVDFSFVNIQRKGVLPAIDLTALRDKENYCLDDLEPIFKVLDPNNFTFEGFTIITLKDKSTEYISDHLHSLIANLSQYKQDSFFHELSGILSTISGSKDIYSSVLPVLELNGYPLISTDFSRNSLFFRELQKRKSEGGMDPILTSYLKQPYPILHGIDASLDTQDSFFRDLIQREGLTSYISIPLNYRHGLVGFVELYSYAPDTLTTSSMMHWRKFTPLLTQLAAEIIFLFKNSLERIVMNNFTAVNPAVEWRFNEVAARQLAAHMRQEKEPPLERVRFEKVHPIYGAIDVKGSTQLRNSIYRSDHLSKIEHLKQFLNTLPVQSEKSIVKILKDRVSEVTNWLNLEDYGLHMLDVFLFINEELSETLDRIKAEIPDYGDLIDRFISQQKEIGDNQSDLFEISLQHLNKLIKNEVQHFNTAVQDVFPSYFELFRSDGVEYDMYVGQSITPTKIFESSFLRTIRKLQIISMVHIGQVAAKVMLSQPVPMQVTLLIFVHTSTIDISFREDERRFDVEGGYNIRYQMVKKRIDKVRIKDTNERLVRPNTLAIIFQGDTLEKEVRELLSEVAAIGMLEPEVEFCTLEEIQGVSELRAIRAEIVLNEE